MCKFSAAHRCEHNIAKPSQLPLHFETLITSLRILYTGRILLLACRPHEPVTNYSLAPKKGLVSIILPRKKNCQPARNIPLSTLDWQRECCATMATTLLVQIAGGWFLASFLDAAVATNLTEINMPGYYYSRYGVKRDSAFLEGMIILCISLAIFIGLIAWVIKSNMEHQKERELRQAIHAKLSTQEKKAKARVAHL